MKYYEAHEQAYKNRLAAGQVAWDQGDYDEIPIRPLVERLLEESGIRPANACVLDVGCGTGGLACMLSSRGFTVTAIDVAPSAITEARKQSAKRGLNIDFRVSDLCSIELPHQAYDLIIDNHFLHCIVNDAERLFVLQSIRKALKPDGEFWTETMVGHPDMTPPDHWNLDEQGVIWCNVSPESNTEGAIERDGEIRIPIRRIRLHAEDFLAEIRQAGFELLWSETEPPSEPSATVDLRARCSPNVCFE